MGTRKPAAPGPGASRYGSGAAGGGGPSPAVSTRASAAKRRTPPATPAAPRRSPKSRTPRSVAVRGSSSEATPPAGAGAARGPRGGACVAPRRGDDAEVEHPGPAELDLARRARQEQRGREDQGRDGEVRTGERQGGGGEEGGLRDRAGDSRGGP